MERSGGGSGGAGESWGEKKGEKGRVLAQTVLSRANWNELPTGNLTLATRHRHTHS